jgi:hypothetical protein
MNAIDLRHLKYQQSIVDGRMVVAWGRFGSLTTIQMPAVFDHSQPFRSVKTVRATA